jgi:hypothetical protein
MTRVLSNKECAFNSLFQNLGDNFIEQLYFALDGITDFDERINVFHSMHQIDKLLISLKLALDRLDKSSKTYHKCQSPAHLVQRRCHLPREIRPRMCLSKHSEELREKGDRIYLSGHIDNLDNQLQLPNNISEGLKKIVLLKVSALRGIERLYIFRVHCGCGAVYTAALNVFLCIVDIDIAHFRGINWAKTKGDSSSLAV